jgi:hypothetical protein
VGGTSGESEERIRQIFESAAASAPSVLFIDAIDVIAGKKDVRLSVSPFRRCRLIFGMFILVFCLVVAARHGEAHRRTAL